MQMQMLLLPHCWQIGLAAAVVVCGFLRARTDTASCLNLAPLSFKKNKSFLSSERTPRSLALTNKQTNNEDFCKENFCRFGGAFFQIQQRERTVGYD